MQLDAYGTLRIALLGGGLALLTLACGSDSVEAPAQVPGRGPTVNSTPDIDATVLAEVAATLAALVADGSNESSLGESSSYIDGVGVEQDIMPTRNHLPEGQSVDYKTTPPTSGDHWATPQGCGFYEDGLPDERITHNLEHGNIVVSYNLPLEADVQALRSAVEGIGLANVWGVTRFYPDIEPGTVALAAWGVLDIMQGVDRDRINRFFEFYSGALGPEIIPC
jgi:hypothetical protein